MNSTEYYRLLTDAIKNAPIERIESLALEVERCWRQGKQVFLCGNGGSAANAIHIANDLVYGATKNLHKGGVKAVALPSNSAVITCLANDISYEKIYSEQIITFGSKGDLLIALSGSGNSPNIVAAIKVAKERGMTTSAILGFDGGLCLSMVDIAIHFNVQDMQISEDLMITVGHIIMKSLNNLTY